jgi:hypothetical protein
MTREPDKVLTIGGEEVVLSASEYDQVRTLLKLGNKIEAIAIIRRRAKLDLRSVKGAVDDAAGLGASVRRAAAKVRGEQPRSWRQWAEQHPTPVIAATVVVMLASLGMGVASVRGASPRHGADIAWYYDMGTERLFAAPYQPAPIRAPSDGDKQTRSGVIARVFTCGQCSEDEWFVSYLEKYMDEALYAVVELEQGDDPENEAMLERVATMGHVVRVPHHDAWLMYDSAKGMQVRRRASQHCEGGAPKACFPQ